jgi:CheY-like chemotaxis protein
VLPLIPSYVTFITGLSLDDAQQARRAAGCVAVLVKPVRAAVLLRGIAEWTAG